ncbi:hypothetical protein VTN96DRAFT_4245 [Rasamsonia emersonii]
MCVLCGPLCVNGEDFSVSKMSSKHGMWQQVDPSKDATLYSVLAPLQPGCKLHPSEELTAQFDLEFSPFGTLGFFFLLPWTTANIHVM